MPKFNVTVIEHRNHTLIVEAPDADAALRQAQIEFPDADTKGEAVFFEAVEAEAMGPDPDILREDRQERQRLDAEDKGAA